MMVIPLREWLRQVAMVLLLDLALVSAFAISLAYWTWVVMTPAAVALPAVPSKSGVMTGATAGNLFGSTREVRNTIAQSEASVRVLGVIAHSAQRQGRAILLVEGSQPKAVAVGEDLVAGRTLNEVHGDHVILMRQGTRERVNLERRGSAPSNN